MQKHGKIKKVKNSKLFKQILYGLHVKDLLFIQGLSGLLLLPYSIYRVQMDWTLFINLKIVFGACLLFILSITCTFTLKLLKPVLVASLPTFFAFNREIFEIFT